MLLCLISMLSELTKKEIRSWALSEPLVCKAYVFGSRARDDYREDSDLDIAVELIKPPGDENLLATWIGEADEMKQRASSFIHGFRIDLQWHNGDETPVILEGLNQSSYVIYEQEKT